MTRREESAALPHDSVSPGSSPHPDRRSAPKTGRSHTSRSVEVPQLLDMAALAATMSTSVRHIQRLVSERRIPYVKVGHFVRFDQSEIVAWLDERRVAVHSPSYEWSRRRR